MSWTLYKTMMKKNRGGIIGYSVGTSLFLLMIVQIYPMVLENEEAMNQMLKAYPEALLSAFGMNENTLSALEGFLSVQYFSLMFLIIVAIFTILMTTKLIARLVDTGSMAYLLSVPTSRVKIITTMIFVFLTGLACILVSNFLVGYFGAFTLEKGDLDINRYFQLNAGGFLLFYAIGGYSILFSAICNDEKRALALSGGITLFFYMANFLGNLNESFDVLKSFSLFTLFDSASIASGEKDIWMPALIFFLIGTACYGLAIYLFKRRNLPL
ncbi:ABC transporter permease [Priestia taiwanensis]|uniref:ABC transporter permease n=1 Tax=Priestia taiwanensis TaxID=1347902 RepID=A0A917AT12_9BACI|nr:ABC transporter permease subunit [Priestia taiwanensis]MBM7363162.1 ABC-2 type transport system permease protein [Priestia taiwanensis]GGE68203.1 ABC transporter permease [Priestia taiwanensis]